MGATAENIAGALVRGARCRFIRGTEAGSPNLSPQQAERMTRDAVAAYCPEYGGR
jgi:hypothetical protein